MLMGYLPIFLDVGGKPCMVIGGGEFAEARVRALLDAGAIVTVVSREAADRIKLQAAGGKVRHLAREYEYGDLRGMSLAYVTTDNPEIARCAAAEARELGIPLNVADSPESSAFISPATFKRGDLQIAISTGGASPAVARMLRQRLEQQIGPGYALVLKIMRQARQFLRNREADPRTRALVLKSLAAVLLDSAEALDNTRIDEALRLHLHASMAELGLEPREGAKGTSPASAPTRD
ncbi:MAG: bifunctional precorrin-2 dehydrogenase/sirohydrochlorin ferrochelatase [Deltaproteobacteria bacterium]|nr:bifunctional precorrin-2 dehydrogenase/sirohydrochlorin ferrochelatase [Deltaproteobacteria bacterium]